MLLCNDLKRSGTNPNWNKVEDWVSGLNQQFTKLSAAKVAREFESLIFRALKIPPSGGYFLARKMSK